MSVEYRGALVIGYDIDELETIAYGRTDLFEGEDIDDLSSREKAETLNLGVFAPYYDADMADRIYGWILARSDDYSATRVDKEQLEQVKVVEEEMLCKYGIKPFIYIMAQGT